MALAFFWGGTAMAHTSLTGTQRMASMTEQAANASTDPTPLPQAPTAGACYICHHCAAPLDLRGDVSPPGDANAGICGGWFNIHDHMP